MVIRHKQTPSPWKGRCVRILLALLVIAAGGEAFGARIKDIAEIQGVRKNQLLGYGLVVGLNGTGDGKKTEFTIQSLASMLEKMGMTVNPRDITVKNVAAVMVSAELPPFARPGLKTDILVSSIGDAKSLEGGTLLFTPLKGADGQIYAIAQGPVSTGSFTASGKGATVQKNFPTVGRVVDGATVENEVASRFGDDGTLTLSLRTPDFTTAARMADAINAVFPERPALSRNSGTVTLTVPDAYRGNVVGLVARIESLDVSPDVAARVIINERTGTVVMGENVRVATVAVAHGNLSIQIRESANVSQPLPFSQGQTSVTPETSLSVKEETAPLFVIESGVTIGDLVQALNAMGVSPRDLVAIFQAIKAAGALQATLEII